MSRRYTRVENAFIDITNECNASCPFCFLRRGSGVRRITMRKGDLDVLFETLENIGVVNITLVGGEPLILPEDYLSFLLFEVIPCYKFKSVNVETNGSTLGRVRGRIIDAFTNVYVSVDYYDRRHELVRGIRVFDQLKFTPEGGIYVYGPYRGFVYWGMNTIIGF